MILLVSGGTRTVGRLIKHPNLGVLLTPKAGNDPPPVGVVWACDNSAYTSPESSDRRRRRGFDECAFRAMLRKIKGRADCEWVTCPDVVGDHPATVDLWHKWLPIIRAHDQRPAFVAQDGCAVESLPWDELGAIFIGGTDRFKLGEEAQRIIHAGVRRGLWIHMGRVNTPGRLMLAYLAKVTSVDGSKFSRWSETHIPSTLDFLAQLDSRQAMLPQVAEFREEA